MTILQSAVKFINAMPWGIWFSESHNKYTYEFVICNYDSL